jgi:ectoine hydroxylase-related dioxygenase (phytanoyl-CoA dioxygenase family)
MILTMGKRELELGGKYLGLLREATDLMGDGDALRSRMDEDGYLLLRGFHDREKVTAVRQLLLRQLDENGRIDRSFPLEEGVIAPETRGAFMGGARAITHTPEFLAVVESPEVMQFFTDFLGAPSLTYDFKWLRVVGRGDFTGAHYDVVYMGQGTTNLYTVWTPLVDVSFDMGPLAVLHGSNRWQRVKETYGRMDVDEDRISGWFSTDPVELVDRYGGQWLTTEFRMGDAIIFGMFTMHGSLNNVSRRFRLSCDTRYQRADEPVDPRWMGEKPKAHYGTGPVTAMDEARKRWGV